MKSLSDLKLDPQDQHLLGEYRWYLNNKREDVWYAETSINGSSVGIHRVIMGVERAGRHVLVDHVDGDGLNNHRWNLRIATSAQNNANARPRKGGTSPFKGVDLHPHGWRARCGDKFIGYFETMEEAARAYDVVAVERYAEFAYTNFGQEARRRKAA